MCSVRRDPPLRGPGCPIRRSTDQLASQLPVAYRRLATSFIGSHRQGIHRAPLLAWPVPGPAVHERRNRSLPSLLNLQLVSCIAPASPEHSALGHRRPPRSSTGTGVTRSNVSIPTRSSGCDGGITAQTKRPATAGRHRIVAGRCGRCYPVPTCIMRLLTSGRGRTLVEPRGFEPRTSAVQRRRSPN